MSVHTAYCDKLKEIGKRLGYITTDLTTKLGTVDAIWSKQFTAFPENERTPVAVFEVISSEKQKALRGSLLNMWSAKPVFAVFVLIREEIKNSIRSSERTGPEQWLERIDNYVEKLKEEYQTLIRIEIWSDEKVDQLYHEYCSI